MELWQKILNMDMRVHGLRGKCRYKLVQGKGFHPGQLMILGALHQMGSCNQRELAGKLSCSPASVGVSVKRMEKSGLVQKLPDEKDLRFSKIQLTPEGNQFALEGRQNCETMVKRMLIDFTQEEQELLCRFLERCGNNLQDYYEELEKQEKGEL